jgi:hypothetical protein
MNLRYPAGLITVVLAVALLSQTVVPPALSASNANYHSSYYGGTIPEFKDAKNPVDGHLIATDEIALQFLYKKDQMVSIPYAKFIDIEYGQKSGRRVGAAVASTLLLGPIGLLFLMSKKQKHFVTIGFKDASDKEQVAVFQVEKDAVRTLLPILEARSGKDVIYQSKSAEKKATGGNKPADTPAEKAPAKTPNR